MPRGRRVKLVRISDERRRQATLRKRKEACIKSLRAICRYCRAKACLIICDGPNDLGPNDENVWPSRMQAATLVEKFMSMSQLERSEKLVTQEKVIQRLLMEDTKKLEELKRKNDELELEEMMNDLIVDPAAIATAYGKLNKLFPYIDGLKEKVDAFCIDLNV
ncbi:hypothetical protein OSB04_026192 [Centaurea solstitialis]|uniref:MADS-box domain-containing protein n=1 Tax=Centaurea solstitialis TaxID=347529 RepID=A0AA38SPN1_9ASTR|nr:hypothetical protein OSB04_026192 [Centaurea solstitialis]